MGAAASGRRRLSGAATPGKGDPATLGRTPEAACRRRHHCSLCGSDNLVRALTLAPTPLANGFLTAERLGEPEPRLPLEVGRCGACGHVQLLALFDPYRLHARNLDAHANAPAMAAHVRAFARQLMERYPSAPGALVVDIGCNDGTFLKTFEDAGRRVQGIEPAANLASIAVSRGIRTHAGFFSPAIAERIEEERGRAAYVVAHMAFAESHDLAAMLEGIALLLARDGVFAFEVAYLADLVDRGAFDSITHRALDYHALSPLVPFLAANDLEIISVERTPAHRGSLRGIAQRLGGPYPTDPSVANLLSDEVSAGLAWPQTWEDFTRRIDQLCADLSGRVRALRAAGACIAGYGATACSTTLLHQAGLDRDAIAFIADDTPAKQGLYTPGTHIPIRAADSLYAEHPDVVIVLAWNYADAIITRHARFRDAGGRFLIPLPELREV
jgi:predicted TPR repeat methyltransferase